MEFSELETYFQIALFKWARADLFAQWQGSFSLVRSVKSKATLQFFATMDKLNAKQQHTFMNGQLKRFHPRAAELLGESLSSEEQELMMLYREMPVTCISPRKSWTTNKLSGVLREVFKNVQHQGEVIWSGAEGRLSGNIGSVTLQTVFYVNPPIWNLRYDHRLYYRDRQIGSQISALAWWGISSQTDWELGETPEEIVMAAKALVDHFLSNVNSLLPKHGTT